MFIITIVTLILTVSVVPVMLFTIIISEVALLSWAVIMAVRLGIVITLRALTLTR